MELSERWIQKFEEEGFASVYEWQDRAGTTYPEHCHQGKVSIYVTDGSLTLTLGGELHQVPANQRLDIPVGVPYTTVVGPHGWIGIVAEKISGDSGFAQSQ